MLINFPENPTSLLICDSGGADSGAMRELLVEHYRGRIPIYVLHQHVAEAWPGTVEYIEEQYRRLGLPLYVDQMFYRRYQCQSPNCGHCYLFQEPHPKCPRCRELTGQQVGTVETLLDLMNHRGQWPSNSIRWCTSYAKRDVARRRIRQMQAQGLLGERPVMALGERWAESTRRSKLHYFEQWYGMKGVQVWHPILHLKRYDKFGVLLDRGIEPHYCYELQGLSRDGMRKDEEGGPRCSCIACFYLTPERIAANLNMPLNAAFKEKYLAFEARHGHYFRQGLPLELLLQANFSR